MLWPGLFWGCAFVLLESVQYVFFGSVFQQMSSTLFGFLVFLITSVVFIGWSLWQRPAEVALALRNPRLLLAINLLATSAWFAFLGAVQLIEPAVAYTIGAGVMPLTAYLAWRWNVPEGEPMRNRFEVIGNLLLLFAVIVLALMTCLGWSGFVRGGIWVAIAGVLLAIGDGVLFTWLLIYCQRLNRVGVQPATVFGLRFPLYVVVAGGVAVSDIDQMSSIISSETLVLVLVGIILIVPPLIALQKAVALLSTLTLSSLTALGPFLIFIFQLIEGRVEYSASTMGGIVLYSAGAVMAAIGAVKGRQTRVRESG